MRDCENSGRVSVVITTKDRPALVREAMASVRAQGEVVRECVVVDDKSEPSRRPPASAADGWPCRIVALPKRVGLPGAREVGRVIVAGEFVLFLDDDDRLTPGSLREMVAAMDGRARAVACVGGRVVFDDASQSKVARFVRRPSLLDVFQAAWVGWVAISGQTLFRAQALSAVGGWDERFDRAAEDQQLWLRLSAVGPVALLPTLVLENRAHEGQTRPADLEEIEESMREELLPILQGRWKRKAANALAVRHALKSAEGAYRSGRSGPALRRLVFLLRAHFRIVFDPLVWPRFRLLLTHSFVTWCLPSRAARFGRRSASQFRHSIGWAIGPAPEDGATWGGESEEEPSR